MDTINLNPTSYLMLVLLFYSLGFLSCLLSDLARSYINKKYYNK